MNDELTPEELQLVESLKPYNLKEFQASSPVPPSSSPPRSPQPSVPDTGSVKDHSLEELLQSVDCRLNKIKESTSRLTTENIPQLHHELEKVADDIKQLKEVAAVCIQKQNVQNARLAAAALLSQGFSFDRIEIDGMKFIITDQQKIRFISR
ncbi:MAG: hypothetical protein PHP23_03705 [Desulfobacterales bacterium]|nr:hypothetical protein [Desulfobacterales bacterium]MDD4071891.1 hypothetical protein [Desulfobacterales bacterium]MDD4392500.1 hypothetical protein [Desulfobacterales bacterium]